ncbi:MAG: tyrosine-type recombinase/integrase [bacterium]
MKFDYLDSFKVDLVKEKKKIKVTYTDAEIRILLKKPNLKKCLFAEYRNWVVINYLLATGNRVGSIVNLKIKDVDFDSGYIHLKFIKNRREQVIPLSNVNVKGFTGIFIVSQRRS